MPTLEHISASVDGGEGEIPTAEQRASSKRQKNREVSDAFYHSGESP